MKQFIEYFSQLKNYRGHVILYVIFYILTAIFTVVSIPALIPLFEMLFQVNKTQTQELTSVLPAESSYLEILKWKINHWLNGFSKSQAVTVVCLLVASIFFLKNLFRYLAIFFVTPVKAGLLRDTRKKLFKKYLELPLSYFSDERKGDLIARMTSDVSELEWTLLASLESWVKDPLVILGSVGFMLYISPKLTLFVVFLLFVTAFIIGGISRTLKKNALQAQNEFGELISIQEESLGGIRVIKAFNSESYVLSRFELLLKNYQNLLIKINRRRELAPPLSEFLGIVVVCILLWFGAKLVFNQEIAGSTFLAFLYAFFNVIEPSKTFTASYFNTQKGMAALERINQVMRIENTIQNASDAVTKKSFDYEIAFNNVSFSYANTGQKTLKNISFKIKKGQTCALVGASGSGKSTIVDLLSRFYDVDEGSITVDQVDIRKIKLDDLRALTGMVTQEPILFNDTVSANVKFGSDKMGDHKIWEALDLAFAKEFVEEEDRGLNFNIGDRGTKLSGGQRQRLTLARAILRNPPIMILDEATSALDSASEKMVQQAMDKMLEDRTAIVIAHRLSTVRHADIIIVLKEGEVVEIGNHEELIANNGEYCNFVNLQSLIH